MFDFSKFRKLDCAAIKRNHEISVAAQNVFYQHIRLIFRSENNSYMSYDTYNEYFDSRFTDIELVTSPIEAFVPNENPDDTGSMVSVNQLVPEYVLIHKSLSIDIIREILTPAHEVSVLLLNQPEKFNDVVDDIFVHFCVTRYMAQIDMSHMKQLSNATELVKATLQNITLSNIKNHISASSKINDEKYMKFGETLIFNPTITALQKFYSVPHGDVPTIDVVGLMKRLISNIVLKTDIYIILSIYLIIDFAMPDIEKGNKILISPCTEYVRDVISKL